MNKKIKRDFKFELDKIIGSFSMIIFVLSLVIASFILTACAVKLFCTALGFKYSRLIAVTVWTIVVLITVDALPDEDK